MSYSVFLSHSGVDLPVVRAIQAAAASAGVGIYVFEDDLMPGANLPEKLRHRIRSADAVVALLTEDGVGSPAVNQEIGIALEAGKLVIPVVEETVDPSKLTFLQGVEYLGFDRSDPYRAIAQLVPRLDGLRADQENARTVGTLLLAGFAVWALSQK